MESTIADKYPLAYTPAMQSMFALDLELYEEAFQCLELCLVQVMYSPPKYIADSYSRCDEAGRKHIDTVCLDMEDLLEDDSKARLGRYGDAVRDMVCYAYLEKQEESTPPAALTQEPISKHLFEVWQTVVRKSATHDKVGKRYSEYFEGRNVASMFARLLRESNAIENIVFKGANTRKGLIALAVTREKMTTEAGHYMIVLTDDYDSDWYRQYVGQSGNVTNRLRLHETQMRLAEKDETMARPLYIKWAQPTKSAHYILLHLHEDGLAETSEEKDSWLCLVEMFYCVVFETLQPDTLKHWIPGKTDWSDHRGLNLRSPLLQGTLARSADSGFGALFSSTDPEIRQRAHDHMDRIRPAAREAMVAVNYTANARGIFKAKGAERHREANENDPEVIIRCNSCKSDKSVRKDDSPKFCVLTGKYIVRQSRCKGTCKLSKAELAGKRTMPSRQHVPENLPKDKWIKTDDAAKAWKKHQAQLRASESSSTPLTEVTGNAAVQADQATLLMDVDMDEEEFDAAGEFEAEAKPKVENKPKVEDKPKAVKQSKISSFFAKKT